MAKVNWINGSIEPPEPGEYYTITQSVKGDVWIDIDTWDGKKWETLGTDNDYWQVLSWARILRPDIPKDLRGLVTLYFGQGVKDDGTVSK